MSRHHLLPPFVYVPQPKPKKIENRKRRVRIGDLDDVSEAGESHEVSAAGRLTVAANKPRPQNFPAIEGAESKPQRPQGRLSETTLKAMLQAQEFK